MVLETECTVSAVLLIKNIKAKVNSEACPNHLSVQVW